MLPLAAPVYKHVFLKQPSFVVRVLVLHIWMLSRASGSFQKSPPAFSDFAGNALVPQTRETQFHLMGQSGSASIYVSASVYSHPGVDRICCLKGVIVFEKYRGS